MVPIISSIRVKKFPKISDNRSILCTITATRLLDLYLPVSVNNFKDKRLGYVNSIEKSRGKFNAGGIPADFSDADFENLRGDRNKSGKNPCL